MALLVCFDFFFFSSSSGWFMLFFPCCVVLHSFGFDLGTKLITRYAIFIRQKQSFKAISYKLPNFQTSNTSYNVQTYNARIVSNFLWQFRKSALPLPAVVSDDIKSMSNGKGKVRGLKTKSNSSN